MEKIKQRSDSRILLLANYKPDGQFSMQRYAELLKTGLEEAGALVHVWYPPAVLTRFISSGNRGFKWVAYIDKFVLGAFALLVVQLSWKRVHICDHSNAMYRFILRGRRVTVTCHDVIAVEAARGSGSWTVKRSGQILQSLILAGLRRCHAVVCVSNYTREHLFALGGLDIDRLQLAYNPVDPSLIDARPEDTTPLWAGLKEHLGGEYVLHVGSDHPRKNRMGVVKIFCALSKHPGFEWCKLLLVGPDLNALQREVLSEAGLLDRVVATGLPAEADLAAAYRGARCLLFPSYIEGFGWPIAEAQALGCPVFTTAAEPMNEVGGDGACFIEPDQHEEAAAIIAITNLKVLSQAGYRVVKRLSLSGLAMKVMVA
jgi:glycosyltransferase involved in cell wall biosynthesis